MISSRVIGGRIAVLAEHHIVGVRSFSNYRPLNKDDSTSSSSSLSSSKPSTPQMKSDKAWINNTSNNHSTSEITRQVIGMTKSIQESNQPPLNISSIFTRNFEFGQVYDPFDFSSIKQDIEKRHQHKNDKKLRDPFEKSGIDPSTLYIYPEILSKYLSSTGQILPRSLTGCNAKNQKKLANAIKTARCCGLLASTNRHNITLPSRIL